MPVLRDTHKGHHMNVKRTAAATGAALLLVGGGTAAYAYWTTNGSGTGTGSTGTSQAITIAGTALTAVTPGGTNSPVNFTATNPAAGPQQVTSITLTGVEAFAGPGFTNPITDGTAAGQCDTSQYTMAVVPVAQNVPGGGATTAITATGTLVMANDTANNQDACKNAVLRLTFTSN